MPQPQLRGSSTPRARALETVQAVKMQRMQPAQYTSYKQP